MNIRGHCTIPPSISYLTYRSKHTCKTHCHTSAACIHVHQSDYHCDSLSSLLLCCLWSRLSIISGVTTLYQRIVFANEINIYIINSKVLLGWTVNRVNKTSRQEKLCSLVDIYQFRHPWLSERMLLYRCQQQKLQVKTPQIGPLINIIECLLFTKNQVSIWIQISTVNTKWLPIYTRNCSDLLFDVISPSFICQLSCRFMIVITVLIYF